MNQNDVDNSLVFNTKLLRIGLGAGHPDDPDAVAPLWDCRTGEKLDPEKREQWPRAHRRELHPFHVDPELWVSSPW